MALLCASFFFWPRDGSRLVGRWNDYIGLGFAMIFAQYLLRYVELTYRVIFSPGSGFAMSIGIGTAIYLCSGLSNLFFLAAARVLLNKSKRVPRIEASYADARTVVDSRHKFKITVAEFSGALPRWAWIVAFLSPLAVLDVNPLFLWARFPDAIFSAYCFSSFGYAIAINFNVRRRGFLAGLALIIALTYAGGQLAYATNPVVAYMTSPARVTSIPLVFLNKIGDKVGKLVLGLNAKARRDVTPKEFLDNAIYSVMLPLKYALFVPTFFLYLLFIISINDFRRTLSETTSVRRDYLSPEGIVRAIGESLGAEKASLFIRLPGTKRVTGVPGERVLPLIWDSASIHLGNRMEPVSISDDPQLLKIMKEQGDEIFDISEEKTASAGSLTRVSTPHFSLAVPVNFQGGVIAALRADVRGYGAFNHSTLQKLRLFAELIAPSVQDFRSLAAIDQIGFCFTRLQVDHPADTLEQSTERMVGVLHDVLAPLATGLIIEMGFFSLKHSRADGGHDLHQLIEGQIANHQINNEDIEIPEAAANIKLEKSTMTTGTDVKTGDGLRLGSLLLAIRADRDQFSRPTLASYYLNRKTIASLTSEGVLDLARNVFGLIIKKLGVEFSTETLSREEWFAAIVRAIREAGLLWVVASKISNEDSLNPREAVEIVTDFSEDETALLAQPMSSVAAGVPALSTNHIVRLILPKSRHQLWIGVARPGFGKELEFQSPWKVFLGDLAEVADMALDSVERRQETEIEKIKAAQYQGVMTIAVTTGTLMHQLVNMVKDQLFATESLEEALDDNEIKLDASGSRLLSAMKRSAQQMRELTEAFKSVAKMEERRPCSLVDATEQAMKLFRVSLMQRRIETRIDVSPEIVADVPFHVAAFALANLIGNAKDAIRSTGTISIEAEDKKEFVLCHVTNTGPPIPADIRDSLFQFGRTNKHGHNGWGLYFVARSLQENGGSIWLNESVAETRFTIRLPKAETN
jgi:signal transduction histidine kinase